MTVFFGIDQVSPLIKSRPIENNQKKKHKYKRTGTPAAALYLISLFYQYVLHEYILIPPLLPLPTRKKIKKIFPQSMGAYERKTKQIAMEEEEEETQREPRPTKKEPRPINRRGHSKILPALHVSPSEPQPTFSRQTPWN